jgi:hypothetical protein
MDFTIIDNLNKKYTEPKYIINMSEDYGPITKLIGGYEYIKKNNIESKNLIIIDDDTEYLNKHIQKLIKIDNYLKDKKEKYVLGNSGFNFEIREKLHKKFIHMLYPKCFGNNYVSEVNIIEGFASIYFNYTKCYDEFLNINSFSKYYRVINWKENNEHNIVNEFLKACFLGDDLIISLLFRFDNFVLYKTHNNIPHQYKYGFENDALHKNKHMNVTDYIHDTSNLNSYLFILENIDILHSFFKKYENNLSIRYFFKK